MDTKSLLDELLQSAKQMASQGQEVAETKLGVPEEGPDRDAMLKGMGKGAMAAGALALLLGTGAGRRLTGTALKLGSLAAIGTIGYKAFQRWQASQNKTSAVEESIDKLAEPKAQNRSLVLLKAMIAAANADGHIDYRERTKIDEQISKLGLHSDAAELIRGEVNNPADVTVIAALADSTESAAEIYLASRLVIDIANDKERAYLDELSAALNLPSGLVSELEAELKA